MSTQHPATEPAPERPEPSPADDDTQRLERPEEGARDGETRVLPGGDEPSGVDSLWDLGEPGVSAAGSPAAGPTPGPSPAAAVPLTSSAPTGDRTGRRAVRVGTVVWGLVVAACGVLALAVAGGATIDGGTVAIAILGGAGVALVLGSIVTGVRRRAHD